MPPAPSDTFFDRSHHRAEDVPSSRVGYGLAILRVTVGVIFLTHGLQKLTVFGLDGVASYMASVGIPLPEVSAVLATAAEALGGLALVLGFFTRAAAAPLAFTMVVASLVHLPNGFFMQSQGFEYTLTLFAATVALILTGPGAASLDALVRIRARTFAKAYRAQPVRVRTER